jgi:hypothetical protein
LGELSLLATARKFNHHGSFVDVSVVKAFPSFDFSFPPSLSRAQITLPRGRTVPSREPKSAIINRAVRCPDPFVQRRGRWVVRRLGSHRSRIELASLRGSDTELRRLHVLGWETANIHLGTPSACNAILRYPDKPGKKWLHPSR